MVKLLDCTIRDGGHWKNWCFEPEYAYKLLEKLNTLNIDFCEIGYRNHYDREGKGEFFYCSPDFLKEFYNRKGNVQLGVMTDVSRFLLKDFEAAQNDFVDFVRVATHPERISEAFSICYELHNRGYKIFLQIMEIPNVREQHYRLLRDWENKDILTSLYIADTYSSAKPADLAGYFAKLRECGYENISFHAHNKTGLALANTLEAIRLGAYSADVVQGEFDQNLNYAELMGKIKD